MPETLIELAPAKVNLALHVTGRRPDGFHELESLVVFAGVSDELHAEAADTDSLRVTGPFATALTPGQSNLVQKAIAAFREKWPRAVPHGVSIELRKNLPVAAGIGGGSADAAAALRLMAELSGGTVRLSQLQNPAAALGADVPVCLLSRTCLVGGIGDKLAPLPHFPKSHVVLVNPLVPIPTADIFRRLRSRQNPGLPMAGEPLANAALLGMWLEDTRNDLQEAAVELVPVIADIIHALHRTRGNMAARMSGSGATVFGLYGTSAEAHQAAHDIRAAWPDFWVAAAPLLSTD